MCRRLKILHVAVCVGLSLPLLGMAQAYRCTVDGKVAYQGTPCLSQGRPVNLSGAGQSDTEPTGTPFWKKEAARLDAEERDETARKNFREKAEAAIVQKNIFVGMTADHVLKSWGPPTKISQTLTATGSSEHWSYSRASVGAAQYVYFESGLVTSIQTSK